MDCWHLYHLMKKSRRFEEEVAQLWKNGLISGEMHLGTGEEAIIAGTVSQLAPGDSMAVDHRGSAAFLMRGVDPILLVLEMLGDENGLCGGLGGHMHLHAKEFIAASSGIVGSAGPSAAGFALAAQHNNPGAVTLAFFGEGAMNQGMLMESLNLAAVWNLPVLFICKDDDWSITTKTQTLTGGDLEDRVRGLGVRYLEVDGLDVQKVWEAANQGILRARSGEGPSFLRARCVHLEGHFLGLLNLRVIRDPLRELPGVIGPLIKSILSLGGAPLAVRVAGLKTVLSHILDTLRDPRQNPTSDPIIRLRNVLKADQARLNNLDKQVEEEIAAIFISALVKRSA